MWESDGLLLPSTIPHCCSDGFAMQSAVTMLSGKVAWADMLTQKPVNQIIVAKRRSAFMGLDVYKTVIVPFFTNDFPKRLV